MTVHLDGYGWHMNIDISYVCAHAGKRDRYYDNFYKAHSYIPVTLTQARKIFRLVKKYADDETIIKTEKYIREYCEKVNNQRVIEQWEKA